MSAKSAKLQGIEIVDTADGSHSLFRPDIQETYHSNHGAFEESMHVYIREGLEYWLAGHPDQTTIRIFEMGFGTGLNALLTLRAAEQLGVRVEFRSIELFPVPLELLTKLNYPSLPGLAEYAQLYSKMIAAPWDENVALSDHFELRKIEGDLFKYHNEEALFDIIYFDAFGLRAQPEVWEAAAFDACAALLNRGGILVTYASNGTGRRAMEQSGFQANKLPGAVGKREMIRAVKQTA